MAFRFCVFTVASDGLIARYGTPFTPLNHFSPWNVDDDGVPSSPASTWPTTGSASALEFLIDGLFNLERFLQLMRNFVAFDEARTVLSKRIAKPHQYFAVTKAVATTVARSRATARPASSGTPRARASRWRWSSTPTSVALHPKLKNPTLVVVTDRTELDGQLFETFDRPACCSPRPRSRCRPDALRDVSCPTGPPAASTSRHCRSSDCPSEERDAGPRPPAAFRPAQHHRHRRRGPPQPLRRPRRLRPPPPRRPAQGDAHRLHRHPDLLRRPQHPGGVRRLHRHLRPHPRRSRTAPRCRSTSSRG